MSKWRRLAVGAVVVAVLLGLVAGCGQQRSAKNTQGATVAAGGSATTMENGRQASAGGNGAIASSSASSNQADPEASGQGESAAVASSAQPSDPSPSGLTQANPSDQTAGAASPQPDQSGESSPGERPVASPSRQPESPSPSGQSTPASAPEQADDASEPKTTAVTFSVTGNADWGTVIEPESIELKDDDTVAELLIRALKSHKLAYETRGSGALFYVTGIDGLFEFDDGPASGWKYRVNDEVIGRSAGVYKPEPGDRIEWFYAAEDEEAGGGGDSP